MQSSSFTTCGLRAHRFLGTTFAIIHVCLISAGMLRAQVSVIPTVSFDAGSSLFSYNYAIENLSALDLAIITLPVFPPELNTVMSLTAPIGFDTLYDPGLGLVSFFEDVNPLTPQTFAPGSTTAPFTFTSPFAPGPVQFDALDVVANPFTGTTLAPGAVPEPSTALVGLVLSAFCFSRVRIHRRQFI